MRGRGRGHRGAAMLIVCVIALGLTPAPSRASVRERAPATPAVPDAISTTVDLGQYAVNGTVRAAVADAATGVTYLGGDFTRIGKRTGRVVVVDPPGLSHGSLQAGSPEVMGVVAGLFPDDRPGDPGFFIVGVITAINGQKVAPQPAYRMHLVGGIWVLDTTWVVSGHCQPNSAQFPVGSPWIATPDYLIGGGRAEPTSNASTTGVIVIDRATGRLRNLGGSECLASDNLLPSIPQLPGLSRCAGEPYCLALVRRLAWEPTSRRLVVEYNYVVDYGTVLVWSVLAAYDLTPATGGRSWLMDLQAGSGPEATQDGWMTAIATLPGAVLAFGGFPLDEGSAEPYWSRRLLIDAQTGSVRQRWSVMGEQDPADGAVIGPANDCESRDPWYESAPSRVGDQAVAWVRRPATDLFSPCRYSLDANGLAVDGLDAIGVPWNPSLTPPVAPYEGADGATYLLGSGAALDLTHESLTPWDPDVTMNVNASSPYVAALTGQVVIGGAFNIIGGMPVPGIVALDGSLSPVATFAPPLQPPVAYEGVNALALSQGRVIVGGQRLTAAGDPLVALESATGDITWVAAAPRPAIVDTIAVAPGGDFWVGGYSAPASPEVALLHYAAPGAGASVLSAPAIGCLTASSPAGSSSPLCAPGNGLARIGALLLDPAGQLYVGGAFGSIGGVARHGLARLDADGAVSPWSPDLLGALPISPDGSLDEFTPRSMAILADNLVVGGTFHFVEPNPNGGWRGNPGLSPIFVFSVTTGALLRPTDPERLAWFTTNQASGFAMVPTDSGLAVALGQSGMAVFDATTLELDETASAGYMEQVWFMLDTGNGVYTLAQPGTTAGTASSQSAPGLTATTGATGDVQVSAVAKPLIIGGVISRWKYRVAGNVLRATVSPDVTAPTTSSVRSIPTLGRTVSSTAIPTRVSWVGADPHGSGVARYQVAMSTSGGSYVALGSSVLRRSIEVALRSGRTYRFRVRAIDNAGNVGSWTYGPMITPGIAQQSNVAVHYSTGWRTVSGTSYLGGSARKSGLAGASASYTFSGRGVGFVSTMAPLRGRAKVYVDGRYIKTIDLRSASARYRTIVYARSWASSGKHTLRIVVRGTSGRPRIDIDAFVVIR